MEKQRKNKIKDLYGLTFGHLFVDSFAGHKDGRALWNCRCAACGSTKTYNSYALLSSRVTSCGCQKKNFGRTSAVLPKEKFRSYKSRSIVKKISFHLSFEDFLKIATSSCFWCGEEPQSPFTHGLDRIDKDQGYLLNNIRPSCAFCNYMKNTSSDDHFKHQITKIYHHQRKVAPHAHDARSCSAS